MMSHFQGFFVKSFGVRIRLYDVGGKMKLNNSIKIIISLTLAVIMLCALPISVIAATKEETAVQPRWTSIATMDLDMVFVGNQGTVAASARKQSTASHIVGTLYLYKWNGSRYEYVDEVSGSKTVGTLGLAIEFEGETGVQYMGVLTVVAYTNGVGESETIECYKTCR